MNRSSSIATVLVTAVAFLCGCSKAPDEAARAASTNSDASLEDSGSGTDLTDSSSWIDIYDPDSSFNGFTLAFYMRRMPILMDMNGRVVHSWPHARVKSRIRLSQAGTLLGIGLDRSVVEYDWEGTQIWKHRFPDSLPHHEVIWLTNGNVLTVLQKKGRSTDDLVEVDRDGNIVWQWSGQRLEPYFGAAASKGDITHINSVQELPPNPWSDGGDLRFQPGNLLISARNLNLIFILDRVGGDVVWTYDHELDLQHEALMISAGMPGAGNILFFNNGYRSAYAYRQSSVVEIDPVSKQTLWRWAKKGFYSPTGGVEQPLPNGNVLISSSRGGRAFEVDRGGRIVWQWIPPYDPNRPRRYPFDHCPQLATLEQQAVFAVEPRPKFRHIDPDVYRFARQGALSKTNIDGTIVNTLDNRNECTSMILPDSGEVYVSYGLNRRPIRKRGLPNYTSDFALTLSLTGSGRTMVLLEDRVDLDAISWRTRVVDLGPYAYETVDLCVSTKRIVAEDGDDSIDFAYWANPVVVSRSNPQRILSETDRSDSDLSAEEREAQKEHLRTLGYLD